MNYANSDENYHCAWLSNTLSETTVSIRSLTLRLSGLRLEKCTVIIKHACIKNTFNLIHFRRKMLVSFFSQTQKFKSLNRNCMHSVLNLCYNHMCVCVFIQVIVVIWNKLLPFLLLKHLFLCRKKKSGHELMLRTANVDLPKRLSEWCWQRSQFESYTSINFWYTFDTIYLVSNFVHKHTTCSTSNLFNGMSFGNIVYQPKRKNGFEPIHSERALPMNYHSLSRKLYQLLPNTCSILQLIHMCS